MTRKQAAMLLGVTPRHAAKTLEKAGIVGVRVPTTRGEKTIAGPPSIEYDDAKVIELAAKRRADLERRIDDLRRAVVEPSIGIDME